MKRFLHWLGFHFWKVKTSRQIIVYVETIYECELCGKLKREVK